MILPYRPLSFNLSLRSLRQLEVEVIRLRHPCEGADLHAGQYLDRIDVKLIGMKKAPTFCRFLHLIAF